MKKTALTLILALAALSCSYEETLDVCEVTVSLLYPDDSSGPYRGARVELKDAAASVFVDSTDAQGTARFLVPPGIYEASSSQSHTEPVPGEGYGWRYSFNGVRSRIVVSPDSANRVSLPLTMSRRRIVY